MRPLAMMGSALALCVAAGALALLWPQAKVQAQAQAVPQVNVDSCSCARPAVAGSGRDQISVYYCTCPGTQCVVTTTTAGKDVPPNLVQTCR